MNSLKKNLIKDNSIISVLGILESIFTRHSWCFNYGLDDTRNVVSCYRSRMKKLPNSDGSSTVVTDSEFMLSSCLNPPSSKRLCCF